MVMGFFRFVLFLFLAYVAFLFVRIYLGVKRVRRRAQAPRQVRGEMVKDEICNTYIPREEALTDVRDGRERYFCSEECRRKSKSA
jgi:YHS domain-containing protein